uniref:Uncharacterized protein n=1 Tax=Globodera rostochiensis TaxID=31243 RepID=A0A914GP44_GLORO
MFGPYQLLILAVVSSVVSSTEVKTTKYSQPFPLDMPVSQTCKEKGQAKCNGTCGWAECVATYLGPLLDFPVAVRKKPLPPLPDFALNAECCPAGHEFRCCEMPSNRKYTWVQKNSNEMISALDEKPECKNKEYCACEFSNHHRMMDGMCCSEDDKCGCCWTDPIISKLPQLLRVPKKYGEKECSQGKTDYPTATCKRTEGWPISSCCDEDYRLKDGDGRFVSYQSRLFNSRLFEWRFFTNPYYEYKYWQHIPRYAWNTEKPHYWRIDGVTLDKDLWGPGYSDGILKKGSIKTVDYAIVGWYWVPRVVPPGTGELPVGRMFSWKKENTADMVGALDKDQKCKDKPVYCACDPLHFDQIMKGMCCDKSTRCECCKTDPTLSKMKKVMAQDPKTSSSCKDQIKANFGEKPTFCQWTEGWKQSAECCDEDYKLLTPRYAIIEGADRHYPLCRNRLPWIYTEICAYEWYWVPQVIGRSR